MKYEIKIFCIFIYFLIDILLIKCEENSITISIKANEIREYKIIDSQYIDLIVNLYINGDEGGPIQDKINIASTNTYNIKMVFNSRITNCSNMFFDCKDIETINLSNIDLSFSTNFTNMFSGCKSLKSIDLSSLKYAKIYNMSRMFYGCSELKSVDLSHLDLSSLKDKDSVFKDCINLESINFSYANLSVITSLNNFFAGLTSLKSIDLSNLFIPQLTNVEKMFFNCSSLEEIDLSFINNKPINNMKNMFDGCKSLHSIDLSNFHFLSSSTSIDMSNMFSNCISLTNVNLSNISNSNSNLAVSMNNIFSNCKSLFYVDLSNFFISISSYKSIDLSNMFYECNSLTSVDFSNFGTNAKKYLSNIFYKCTSLKSIDLSPIKNINTFDNSFNGCTSLKSINFPDIGSVTTMSKMFYGCDSLISLDLSNLNFGNLLDVGGMFYLCSSLIKINLENSQLSSVTKMDQMFYNCDSLISVNFNNIKLSSLENMYQMFYGCDSLISLDLSSINSKKIKNITQLFYKCSSLENLNLSNFDTSLITDMEQVFYDCRSLESLNLSSFNTSSVRNMKGMFSGCSALLSLNLENFNFSSILNAEDMFNGCSELDYVNIYNFHDINGTGNMFNGVKDNLVFCIRDESKATTLINNLKSGNCKILECSENYEDYQKKLIMKEEGDKKCYDKCYYDDVYKYELKNKCYEKCPEEYAPNNVTFMCEKMCQLIINFITKNDKECVYIFHSSSFYLGEYEMMNSNNNLTLYIVNETINDITNGTLDFLLLNVTNENKAEFIIKGNKEIFQITSSYNQNNKEYNDTSKIYLGECERTLREHYDVLDNETLIIFKLDNFVEGINIPIIKYEIFHPNTKEKLDLSLCKNIQTIYPVSINESILFKHDPNSDYYNDICYPYTTEKETDIVLYDRKNEYNINNMSLCEKNCNFIEYNYTTKKVLCECDPQNRSPLELDDIINKERLLNNFVDIKSISNINLLKCYETLFSKDGLINNVGNYTILSIMLIYLILLLIFIIKGYTLLIGKIQKIMKLKKIEKAHINTNENITKKKDGDKINDKENENENEKNKKNEKDDKLIVVNPINVNVKKAKKNNLLNEKSMNNLINSNSSVLKLEKNKEMDIINEDYKQKKTKIDLTILNTKNEYKEEQKTEDFSFYNDYELNSFSYKDAADKDKRSFIQLLISLIKTKHLLIFTFYPINDYNSQIMKICLFLFSFSLYYAINALFFNDETMHKIFEDEGVFNFIYFIPQIIYSIIISSIINLLIKELSLSERNIVKIKKEKDFIKSNELLPKVIACLIVKFILFFFFSFLFLLLFWYYISCFGAVYRNTQIILLKDTLISFLISLVYPFIFYLLIAFIRYCTLSKKDKCVSICYRISQLIV